MLLAMSDLCGDRLGVAVEPRMGLPTKPIYQLVPNLAGTPCLS